MHYSAYLCGKLLFPFRMLHRSAVELVQILHECQARFQIFQDRDLASSVEIVEQLVVLAIQLEPKHLVRTVVPNFLAQCFLENKVRKKPQVEAVRTGSCVGVMLVKNFILHHEVLSEVEGNRVARFRRANRIQRYLEEAAHVIKARTNLSPYFLKLNSSLISKSFPFFLSSALGLSVNP